MIMKKGLLVIFIFSFLNGYSQKRENEYNKMIDTALSFMVQVDRRLKKGIRAWKIIPVLKGNRMTITIIDFRITYKSNKYNYTNGGGAEFVFEFSCEKKAWILLARTSRGL